MKTRHAAFGLALVAALSGPAMAQTGASPSGMPEMTGRHSMQGTVTSLDQKKGWIHLKTHEGTLIMQVPPESLQSVKKGDTVTVDLALKDNGPSPKR
jgi:hypothetical protein